MQLSAGIDESAKGSKCTLILLASALRLMVNGELCLGHESTVDAIECTGIDVS